MQAVPTGNSGNGQQATGSRMTNYEARMTNE
jgi:hypothetical protein